MRTKAVVLSGWVWGSRDVAGEEEEEVVEGERFRMVRHPRPVFAEVERPRLSSRDMSDGMDVSALV